MNITEEILNRINIVDYISKFVNLRRSGSNYTWLCPFHNEKSPSFMVSEDKQIYKCFGCGNGGNVITFAMEYDRLDFRDAINELAKYANIDTSKYDRKSSVKDSETKDEKEKLKTTNNLINVYFQNSLTKNDIAKDYLHNKRKLSDEVIARFGLWYATDNQYDLPQYLISKWVSTSDMYMTWMVRQWSGGDNYGFFRNRISFPIYDTVDNIVGFTSRIINPADNPKYLNTSETPLFNKSKILYGLNIAKHHIKEHNQIIVVEWNMDVIALYRVWLPIWVATCGTSLTQDHIKILKRYGQNISLLFDNDNAGFSATVRAVKLCLEQDIYPQVLSLPKWYKDADDIANDDNLSLEEKKNILTSPTDSIIYIYNILQTKHNISNPVEKKILLNEMFDLFSYIPDLAIRNDYMNNLAELLWTNATYLIANYQSRSQKNKTSPKKETIVKPQMDKNMIIRAIWENDRLSQNFDINTNKLSELWDIYMQIINIVWHPKPQIQESDYKVLQLQLERDIHGQTDDKKLIYIANLIKSQCEYIYKLYFKWLETKDKAEIINQIKKLQNIKI